jgi:uncharacterized membrane protein YbjE (DUF340 family)
MFFLIFLIAGLAAGWVLKPKGRALDIIRGGVSLSIGLLLFLMGLSIGSDKTVLLQWRNVGSEALIITLFSVAGSLLAGVFIWKKRVQK